MIQNIKKRDGSIAQFNQNKITEAIFKAAESVGGKDQTLAEKISNQVCSVLEVFFKDPLNVPSVEQIQDLVEKILIENGHAKTAKAYILYRQEHSKLRQEKSKILKRLSNTIALTIPEKITIKELEDLLTLSEKLNCAYKILEPEAKKNQERGHQQVTLPFQESENSVSGPRLTEVALPPIESLAL